VAEIDVDKILENVQSLLFSAGADLACAVETAKIERVQAEDISHLKKVIDQLENELTPLKAFILPGGAAMSAHIHLARSICRRAERNIVRLSRSELINPLVLVAVNRIPTFCLCCSESLEFSVRRSRSDMEQREME
jgi:cob(I)alamin adenosyltransferase